MNKIPTWYSIPNSQARITHVSIVGGGLAGMSLAYHCSQMGLHVCIYDSAAVLPNGASQNQIALIKPQLSPDDNLPDQYYTAAFMLFKEFMRAYPEMILSHGILEVSHNKKIYDRHQGILKKRKLDFPIQYLSADAASILVGTKLNHPGLYLPEAFLLDVPRYYNLLKKLAWEKLEIITEHKITHLAPKPYEAIVLCHGYAGFENFIDTTTLLPCPGQLSLITPAIDARLNCTLSFEGYLTPFINGKHILGASFRHDNNLELIEKEHQQQLNYLHNVAPKAAEQLHQAPWQGWCAMRTTSKDHLPLIGGIPIKESWLHDFARIKFGDFRKKQYPNCPYYPNLYMSLAHGSKGVLSSFYAGKILAELITKQQLITSEEVWTALHPARFWLRALKRSH